MLSVVHCIATDGFYVNGAAKLGVWGNSELPMLVLAASALMQVSPFNGSNALESPRPWQWAFQVPASTQMEGLYDLYLDVMMVLVGVGLFVLYLFVVGVKS